MEIPVIYQDEHLIVVDKPADLPVHKNDFMPHDADYLTKLVGDTTGQWIYNVHRLDSKTSGVIVLALSKEVAHELTLMFERKEVQKKYYAVVQGDPGEGTFDSKVLVKKKSKFKKPAITHYKTLRTVQTALSHNEKLNIKLSYVELRPETGRWHQLRQHLAKNYFDILGDSHHGDFTLNKMVTEITGVKRLFLHAGKLAFTHPVTREEMEFEAAVPETFFQVLDQLQVDV
ncbi:tRNA pseudouridine(65) synthase TruC [Maribellus sp. CM-23]|uniref:RluA family pseudouridine synthase n=1 Tax=Maribellus sp. CM-23 TaxID=2781026 RepID=UPI001F30FAD2|nr:pseudouridine synthase [Maribellus sp. CM-23]MCE4566935.1 tRNA pseudouridine(65) synthase TruC [Maribellus sp. CM-23]